MLDDQSQRVTLLVPWEHAVLVLCDGSRTVSDIAKMLGDGISDGVDRDPVAVADVLRCVQMFVQNGLIETAPTSMAPPGPVTMANIQQAYREWHKDPEKSGRLLSGMISPPFLDDPPPFRAPGEPTKALRPRGASGPVTVGSTLVVDGQAGENDRALRSVLSDDSAGRSPSSSVNEDELTNVAELLAAVDFELAEASDEQIAPLLPVQAEPTDQTDRDAVPPETVATPSVTGLAVGGVAELKEAPPTTADDRPPADADTQEEPLAQPSVSFRHRHLSEAALTPTLVGHAPPDGDGPPVIVSPARDGRSPGRRVMASVGPEPGPPDDEAATVLKNSPLHSKREAPARRQNSSVE
ncbi:MAG: hypothetical protein AAFV29_13415 [Myxococcota bacterium]